MNTTNGIKPIGNPDDIRTTEDAIVCRYYFDNGYGASAVCRIPCYVEGGVWYLAVLACDSSGRYSLCYETPITEDDLGYLTPEEAAAVLEKIAALPPRYNPLGAHP